MAVAFAQATTVNGELSLPGAWGMIALVAANLFVVLWCKLGACGLGSTGGDVPEQHSISGIWRWRC